MPTRRLPLLTAACALALAGAAPAAAVEVDRIEPGNWWVGMQHRRVELLLHGRDLADATVVIDRPGVRLLATAPGDSPQWRFATVEIAADAAPGPVPIRVCAPAGGCREVTWRLDPRVPGSAVRRGFGPQDALYLAVPDRFANGDPGNDRVPGLREDRVDRSDPDARHGGDLAGLRRHLDAIAALGMTQLWLTPVQANDQPSHSYHGYAITDLYRIDPRLGTLDDYRALAREARARGLGLIMDVVPNHIGSGHPWLADPPRRAWIHGDGRFRATTHRRTTVQDPHAAPEDRAAFQNGWFVPAMPDLDQRDPQLARYLLQNTLWWIETAGLSGLRVDTFSYADPQFLSDWARGILAEYPAFTLVGEEWSTQPAIVAHWQRGKHNPDGHVPWMPAMFDFPLQAALLRALGAPADAADGWLPVYETLALDFLYPDPGRLVVFAENHDTPRLLAALDGDVAGWRLAMALLATTRGIPQFFYGSEVLLRGPVQRDDGRVRADMPGGWRGDPQDAFSGRGLSPEQQAARAWLAALLQWRRRTPLLHTGALTHYAPEDDVYVYFRHTGRPGHPDRGPAVMVALNRAPAPRQLDPARFARFLQGRHAREALTGAAVALDAPIRVPARGLLLLELR
ncbi:alpha-amylase family glycosyl hydrolase [Thermomonas flagellata]|uniref:alpha-amylase family glycosyl hydrolase n=1 Tax=Thermomonas flagellata TaxID=2888524 RepID=UPI001F03506B|nr:alpha-amylase family glycosyl hydrolase [Thermomonas flagellata]